LLDLLKPTYPEVTIAIYDNAKDTLLSGMPTLIKYFAFCFRQH
jgi:hypothetical protein